MPTGAAAVLEAKDRVKNARKKAPKGYPKSGSQYADPAHKKYPIDQKHIRAAVSYFNQGGQRSAGGYSPSQWAAIGRRIASAASRLIRAGYRFLAGKIKTPSASAAKEGYADLLELGYDVAAAVIEEFARQALEEGDPAFLAFAADGDGDDDDDPTDPDEQQHALEEAYPWGIVPIAPVVGEEVSVNGVPCFQYESMVVPGDAVSRNTIPGKKGPTYYPAKRVRQYVADNNALLQSMEARNEHVTVYPRHAAAMLDASLPLGWVQQYFTRPSASGRQGIEDAWYRGVIPLTSDGIDARLKMRAGLVKFSSLRTFQEPQLELRPTEIGGRTVEEAVKLPIAGIDLVATAPGLPVTPIRLVEELLADPVPSPTDHRRRSHQFAPRHPHQQRAGAQEETPAMPETPKYACTACGADVSDVVTGATAKKIGKATEEVGDLKAKVEKVKGERDTAQEELKALKKSSAEAAEALPKTQALYEEAQAKNKELEAQLAALASFKTAMEEEQKRSALIVKLDELVAGDTNKELAALAKQAVEELDPMPESESDLKAAYWKARSAATEQWIASRMQKPTGRGYVNAGAAGEEADPTKNGQNGQAKPGSAAAAHLPEGAQAILASWK